MLVVTFIIALLAALIVPGIQYAQRVSVARKCMNTARQIAGVVHVYASGNKGWTPFESEYYVKLLDFKLNSENGYFPGDGPGWADTTTQSRTHAQTLDDLWCPVDKGPPPTRHAIRSSYQVTLIGQNLLQLDSPSQVLLLREVGKRHLEGGELAYHLVFADLHPQLGSKGKFVSGLDARWWQGDVSQWPNVCNNTCTRAPDFVSVWSQPLAESEFSFLPSIGAWASSVPDAPNNVLMRMDGYIEFPKPGQWFIISYTNDEVFFWLDLNGNGQTDTPEQASVPFGSNFRRVLELTGIEAGKKYRCAVGYREATGPQRLNVYWSQDPIAASNVGRAQRSLIPPSALFFLP
jgi:type II secretory pathway pseudopilin PulG